MMKKTMLAVALLMVSGVVVAGDEHATCSSKGLVSRMGCTARRVGKAAVDYPTAAVQTTYGYAVHGKHSGSRVAIWGDRAVRLTGLAAIIYHGLVPASVKTYAYISAQVAALKVRK